MDSHPRPRAGPGALGRPAGRRWQMFPGTKAGARRLSWPWKPTSPPDPLPGPRPLGCPRSWRRKRAACATEACNLVTGAAHVACLVGREQIRVGFLEAGAMGRGRGSAWAAGLQLPLLTSRDPRAPQRLQLAGGLAGGPGSGSGGRPPGSPVQARLPPQVSWARGPSPGAVCAGASLLLAAGGRVRAWGTRRVCPSVRGHSGCSHFVGHGSCAAVRVVDTCGDAIGCQPGQMSFHFWKDRLVTVSPCSQPSEG